MKKAISILGSTGSIGVSSLKVIEGNPDSFQVVALAGHKNVTLLAEQIQSFQPELCAVAEGMAEQLKALLPLDCKTRILEGVHGQIAVATHPKAEQVIAAIVGSAGILPVMRAIEAKKDIALANKECIVLAGELVMKAVQENGVVLLPVDSEHNAIYQALAGSNREEVSFITLTASGGPFRDWPKERFAQITKADALNHPNWSMGAKITIDSASMMNKALEIIEAKFLFDLEPEQIKVLVHKESIIHSMVTYLDNSFIAQLGVPDMRVPIAYCLAHPKRVPSTADCLNLAKLGALHFEEPDFERFPTLRMAYEALKLGGGAPAALNGANEALVALFLEEKIRFMEISSSLEALMQKIATETGPDYLTEISNIEDAILADQWGRDFVTAKLSH